MQVTGLPKLAVEMLYHHALTIISAIGILFDATQSK